MFSQNRLNDTKKDVSNEELNVLIKEQYSLSCLQEAIVDGLNSGVVTDFDPTKHLEQLKMTKNH